MLAAPSQRRQVLTAATLLVVAGCASVPSGRISADRMDYGQVIAESWKRQTLLNVVRLRYADAPVFLDVASVINSYSVTNKGTANLELPSRADPNVFRIGAEGTWSNTPTVTYQPVLGDRFTKSLLQPVPPTAVFQLLQSGWPAELVLQTVVGSINGLQNDSAGMGEDPGFRRLVEALSRIQRAGGLSIRVEQRKDGSSVVVVLRGGDVDSELRADARSVRDLLGLEEGSSEFEVTYGLLPRSRREVAVMSRSMLELMLQLGFGIELPPAHAADGRVTPGRREIGVVPSAPLARIRSGIAAPAETYTSVQYKDHWYWIDDKDIASKRVFTFLLILFSLAETGPASASPIVTVPSR